MAHLPLAIGAEPASLPHLRARTVRAVTLGAAGALPVLSISVAVFGILPMDAAAPFLVLPAGCAAAVVASRRSREAWWAVRGFVAGLLAVAAYDAVRIPLVVAHIWPDFIPRIGGWVLGTGQPNIAVGYVWRYVGDGGGIGLVLFVVWAWLGIRRDGVLGRHCVAVGVAYGIFVWSGLLCTIALSDDGSRLLFALTPTSLALSLLGHLIYGSVLGLSLGRSSRRDSMRFGGRERGRSQA